MQAVKRRPILAPLKKAPGGVPKRRLPRPPTPTPPDRFEREYRRLLFRLLKEITARVRRELVPQLPALAALVADGRPTADRLDADWADALKRLLDAVSTGWFGLYSGRFLEGVLDRLARGTADLNRRELDRALKTVLGVDVLASEPWLEPQLRAFAVQNVALIKTVARDYFADVERVVFDGFRAGLRHEAIAKQLRETLPVKYQNRAKLIARDQISKLNGQLTMLRQEQIGVRRYTWRSMRDARVRKSHQAMDGRVCEWGKRPLVDGVPVHPTEAVQCFPGSTAITHAHGVRKAFRRRYTGKLAFIVTDDGGRLDGTPNHPVLTGRGWLPLKALQVGDYVFQATGQGALIAEADKEGQNATLGEVFGLLSVAFELAGVRGAAEQFHGDGTDADIDVVAVHGGLLKDREAASFERVGHELLTAADVTLQELPGARAFSDVLRALGFASDGVVRGLSKLLALASAHTLHPEDIGGATASWLEARREQMAADDPASHAILFGQSHLTGPGAILCNKGLLGELYAIVGRARVIPPRLDPPRAEILAEIVGADPELSGGFVQAHAGIKQPLRVIEQGIGKDSFSGHVFNLETGPGWYVAEGIAVRNCRCYAEPLLEDLLPAAE